MTSFEVTRDAEHRRYVIGGEPMIFHCHHYNVFLQRSLLDAHAYLDMSPMLVGAAASVAHAQLTSLFAAREATEPAARAAIASELYAWAGFGTLSFDGITKDGGRIETSSSHYALGWKAKFGASTAPTCFFASGFIAGACAAIVGAPLDAFEVVETACAACGATTCAFDVKRAETAQVRVTTPGLGALTTHRALSTAATKVDYEGIFGAVSGLPLVGDEEGIIRAFGVILTRHYANYYNTISFEFLRSLERSFGDEGREAAVALLVEAGRVCAFNTFGGIMMSTEWNALIRPTLTSREEWVHGMVAVANTLGWGRWQVESVSEDEAVFVIQDDYESVGYLAAYGNATKPVSFLAQGGVAGLMSLVYTADIASGPTLDDAFYERTFRSGGAYIAQPIKSRAMGDDVTSFRVRRG